MPELTSGHASACVDPERRFTVRACFDDSLHVVEMSGELDLASCAAAIQACTSIDHLDLLVDLSGLVFMDCAGYDALVAAKMILERRGGSLVLMNAVGEPLRLLVLIEQLELGLWGPLRIRHHVDFAGHDGSVMSDATTADRLAVPEPASARPTSPRPCGRGVTRGDLDHLVAQAPRSCAP